MVARAIFTTKTDILPWPSLKGANKFYIMVTDSFKRSCQGVKILFLKSTRQTWIPVIIILKKMLSLALLHSMWACCDIMKVNIVCIFTPLRQTLQSHISHCISLRQMLRREKYTTSHRLSSDMLLTGHRLPAGSWAAGWWTVPHGSGGWWACACSAGKKWWTVPFLDEPQRGQCWGP